MKRTGPTNRETRTLAVQLDKHGKASQHGVYRTLSKEITRSTRQRTHVNLDHLNTLSASIAEKVLVVPGKVLAKGTVTHPLSVAAWRFSDAARKKIVDAKGNAWNLDELIAQKIPANKLVLVK